MEDILSALYFICALGWGVFLLSVVFGIAPRLFKTIMRDIIQRRKLLASVVYGSYIGTVISLIGVILLNLLLVALVFEAEQQVSTGSPFALVTLIIGIMQAIGIWGPTVKALFIYYALRDREGDDK